jgi:hypothetical protein
MAGLATHALTCATEGKEATRTPKSGMSLVTDTLIHDNRELDTSYRLLRSRNRNLFVAVIS